MTKRYFRQAVAVSIPLVVVAFVAYLRADEGDAARRPADLVVAAKDVFEATKTDFEEGKCVIEDVHLWSERLMKAELALGTNAKAVANHADRMRKLYVYMEGLAKANPARGMRYFLNAKYYRLEAETLEAATLAKPPVDHVDVPEF